MFGTVLLGVIEVGDGKKKEIEGLYYHQVFFHYVLADGIRANFAFDRGN